MVEKWLETFSKLGAMLLAKTMQTTQQPAFQQMSMLVAQKISPEVTSNRPFIQPGLASQPSNLPATSAGALPVSQDTGPVTELTSSKKSHIDVHQQPVPSVRKVVCHTGLVTQSATSKKTSVDA